MDDNGQVRLVRSTEHIDTIEHDGGVLQLPDERGEYKMDSSSAHNNVQVSIGDLGMDLIGVDQGDGFVTYMHPDDILIPVHSKVTLTHNTDVHPTSVGSVHTIERCHTVTAL